MPPLAGRASTACYSVLYLDASIVNAVVCAKAASTKLFINKIRSAFLKKLYRMFFIL